MTHERVKWTIEDRGDGAAIVRMAGDIDENSNLGELLRDITGRTSVMINLSDIARINSVGVREWVNFVRQLGARAEVTLDECSPVIVSQLNMIANFAEGARITSVQAPYVCESCGDEERMLVSTANGKVTQELVAPSCPDCGEEMELDDLAESYFSFLDVRR